MENNNSNDPEYNKKNFERIKNRLRITGAGGVSLSEGEVKHDAPILESDKVFEDRKRSMVYKGGVATFNAPKKNVPNARNRNNSSRGKSESSIKVFAISEPKIEEKEKHNE